MFVLNCVRSGHHNEFIPGEEPAAAFPAVIRHPDVTLFKRSQRKAAEVFWVYSKARCSLLTYGTLDWFQLFRKGIWPITHIAVAVLQWFS